MVLKFNHIGMDHYVGDLINTAINTNDARKKAIDIDKGNWLL
jgi:hypothetical protein